MLAVERFHDLHRVTDPVEKVGIAEGDVLRAHRHLPAGAGILVQDDLAPLRQGHPAGLADPVHPGPGGRRVHEIREPLERELHASRAN